VRARIGRTATRLSVCPSCGPARRATSDRLAIIDDRVFYCHVCGAKGSIVDAAAALWQVSPFDAARILVDGCVCPVAVTRRAASRDDPATDDALARAIGAIHASVRTCADEPACLEYLCVERALPEGIVRAAQAHRLLGFLPAHPRAATRWLEAHVGRPTLHAAGLWKPDQPVPWIAHRPIVFFLPGDTSAEFRVLGPPRAGIPKSVRLGRTPYPYFWPAPDPTVRSAMLVEGFIDLLSAVALGYPGAVVGFPGCTQVRAETLRRLAVHHGIARFDIAFDNDVDTARNPGQHAARRVAAMLAECGLPGALVQLPGGDLNDLLVARHRLAWSAYFTQLGTESAGHAAAPCAPAPPGGDVPPQGGSP